jgi:CHASE3 domain sensor protein
MQKYAKLSMATGAGLKMMNISDKISDPFIIFGLVLYVYSTVTIRNAKV